MTAVTWQRPARRRNELGMIILVLVLTGGLYSLSSLGAADSLPANIIPFLVLVAALMLVAHFALRRLAPQADPVLLPLAALLNGMGYVFIAGLNTAEASAQATWTAVAVVAFVGTLALFPRAVTLERYRYSFAFVGVALLVLPLVPHIGEDVNGARLWVHVGPSTFNRKSSPSWRWPFSSLPSWQSGPTFWLRGRAGSVAGWCSNRGTWLPFWPRGACRY